MGLKWTIFHFIFPPEYTLFFNENNQILITISKIPTKRIHFKDSKTESGLNICFIV